ncbi:MAG: hypothetical protein LC772_11815, partial [Chloroflexi bacterium]|nr:hypothetical protein [Chloroflexota bacterium]
MSLHIGLGARRRRLVLSVALGLVLAASLGAAPAHAQAIWSGSCAVRGTISFSTPVTPVPALVRYQLNASSLLTCVSAPSLSTASL